MYMGQIFSECTIGKVRYIGMSYIPNCTLWEKLTHTSFRLYCSVRQEDGASAHYNETFYNINTPIYLS